MSDFESYTAEPPAPSGTPSAEERQWGLFGHLSSLAGKGINPSLAKRGLVGFLNLHGLPNTVRVGGSQCGLTHPNLIQLLKQFDFICGLRQQVVCVL